MALKKNENQKPAFEDEGTTNGATAVADKPAAEAPKEAAPAESAPAAAAQATTAIAKAAGTSVAAAEAASKAKAFQKEFAEMRGAANFDYGNFDVYKGNNGEISKGGEDSLGRWVKVRLLAWDEHFEISPGEKSASSKDFVAYSKDGKIVDSVIGEEQREWVNRPVADYVQYLQVTEEFEGAKSRRFIDMSCALLSCENAEDSPIGTVVQITLSQSSIPSFSAYQEQLKSTARAVELGLPGFSLPDDPFTFFLLREAASKGDNQWTKLKIVKDLPNKI